MVNAKTGAQYWSLIGHLVPGVPPRHHTTVRVSLGNKPGGHMVTRAVTTLRIETMDIMSKATLHVPQHVI